VRLAPTAVHAVQVGREQTCLVTTSSGPDFDNGVFFVVRILRRQCFGQGIVVRSNFGVELTEFDIRALPFYDGDVETAGDPEPVVALKDAIREADALLIATPEYNRGIPGGLKNAVDWASRPPLGSPLAGKHVAMMGASTGRGGTALAQQQLREALEFPRAVVLDEPQLLVAEAYLHFDDHGDLVDEGIRAELAELLDTLVHVAGGVTLAA